MVRPVGCIEVLPVGTGDFRYEARAIPAHTRARRSHSYYLKDGTLTDAPFDFDTGITVSNGGLNAPIEDLAKWMGFLIGGNPDADTVLKRSSLEEMFKPVVPVVASAPPKGPDRGRLYRDTVLAIAEVLRNDMADDHVIDVTGLTPKKKLEQTLLRTMLGEVS